MKNIIVLSTIFLSTLACSSLLAQAPGNLVRGYTFEFTFEESDGVAPEPETVDEYLIVTRENNRGERIGMSDGADYLWDYSYEKVPPSGAIMSFEIENPPEQPEDPEEEPVVYYVSQSFTLEFNDPFSGTFTYEVTDSEDETGTAAGTFVLVRGPWKDVVQDPNSGWADVSWYGIIYVIGYPWCFQEDEGWVYIDSDDEGDMWQYRGDVEWHWTSEDVFPFCYQADDGEGEGRWLYVYVDDPDSNFAIFFVAGSDEVIIVPKS